MTNNISIFTLISIVLLLEYYFQRDKKPIKAKEIPTPNKPRPSCNMYNNRAKELKKIVQENQNNCAHLIRNNELSSGIKKELETFKDGKYMKDVDEIIGNVEIGTYN